MVLKIERGLRWTLRRILPLLLFDRERITCLRGHFSQYDFKKSPPFRKYAMNLCII